MTDTPAAGVVFDVGHALVVLVEGRRGFRQERNGEVANYYRPLTDDVSSWNLCYLQKIQAECLGA